MHVSYKDDRLRRLAEDPSYSQKRWGPEVVKAYRKKIQLIQAAVDDRDLYASRALRLEKLQGDRAGTYSIRLNKQFRLVVTFDTDQRGRTVVVIEIVDYH